MKPREDVWYSCNSMGHNTLASTVPGILKEAGIAGYFTNHSLRATSATRLFDAGVDEQLIMAHTGHCSSAGVRSYKRISKQLCEKTSEIFNVESCNTTVPANPIENVSNVVHCDQENELPSMKKAKLSSETVKIPGMNFANASHFTLNFNFQ